MNKTMKIKICGLRRPQDIQAVNRSRPDYIGFVFAPKSKRYVTPKRAAMLKAMLSPDIASVGVFVNEERELIADLLNQDIISIVQLHGQETEEDISWIKRKTGAPVIKAVSVRERADITRMEESCADFLLFDHGSGGTGQSFDWSLLKGVSCRKRYFLAGGISLDNIAKALAKGAYAVDVSGGAETDGWKDEKKIARFVQLAHMSRADCMEMDSDKRI